MQEAVLEGLAKICGTTAEALTETRMSAVPLQRAAEADECAKVVWFLLSADASYLTGQGVDFSGGLVMW